MKLTQVLFLLAMVSASAVASQDRYDFASAEQRDRFLSLTSELRCPMCQNQNIADSDAMIAHDMRRKVYALVKEGQTEQQVIDYMKVRYGDFVYYKPPVTVATIWLWLVPAGFIALGIIFVLMRRKPEPPEDMATRLAQAENLLKRKE